MCTATHISVLQFYYLYFNEDTAEQACERFLVRAKQLSRVLTGRKYMGGTQARKRKTTDEPPAKCKKTDS